MKKAVLLLVSGLIALALTGCSLFASGSGKGESRAAGSIEISDAMIHEPPTDLDYANKYVYHAPEISADTKAVYEEQYGTTLEKEFLILYCDKDDTPLRAYYYLVLGDPAGAERIKNFLDQSGDYETTVTGNSLCYIENQEALSASIDTLIAMNIMSDKTGRAYVDMYCKMDELTEYVSK